MAYFRERSVQKYGESFRAPNLLTEIHQAVPGTKFLILVRNPLEYVVSAHSKRVFQKNDIYDQTRLIPLDRIDGFSSLPLAEKIAWHWVIVNTYLLDFFESDLALARLMTIANLDSQVDEIVDFLGVKITDRSGLSALLNSSPNKKESSILPEGFEPKRLDSITGEIWQKAIKYGQGQR
jgi:hypothetical protein